MKARQIHPPRPGFTLIELLVVAAIIALLIAIVLPSLGRARSQARNVQCLNNLHGLFVATSVYIGVERKLPNLNNDPNEGAWQYNYLVYDGDDYEECFGPLGRPDGPLGGPQQLYCPVQEDPFHQLGTQENPWPVVKGFDLRAGYSRRYGLSGKQLTEFRHIVSYAADLMHLPDAVESGHKTGVNVVWIDGHARWVKAPKLLIDNDLAKPFDPKDNPIVKDIWDLLDEEGR